MPCMLFCSHYRQLFYDTVVTVTLGWHHRRWLMTHLTAPLSQNKLSLLQQSATFIKIALKTGVAQLYRFSYLNNPVYYWKARNIWINDISFSGQLSWYSDWLQAWGSGVRITVGTWFSESPHRSWGPIRLIYDGYRIIPMNTEGKAWGWPPIPSRAKVKESVQQYLYSKFWP
jgi:hypothetical protein